MTGMESWSKSGREEHAQGEAEYKAAQAKGYAEGTIDRVGGKVDSVVGAISGDKQQQASGALAFLFVRGIHFVRDSRYLQETFAMMLVSPSRRSTSPSNGFFLEHDFHDLV